MNWIEKTFSFVRGIAPIFRNRHHPAQALPAPLSGEKPEELAWAGGLVFGGAPMEFWNPDDLVSHQGYAVYRKILKDDQVRALLALKQAMITSRNWHFRPVENNRRQRDCAEFFRFLLEKNLRGPFKQALSNLMSSQAFGFSLLEKVYQPVQWKERTLWGICQLKLRPAETFTFEMDAHGNMTGLLQEQGGRKASLPPWRFIHHVNKPEVHPLYGESDLREVHRHWWSKENILKFWNIYLERMAAGFVHGRISGPLSAAEREELKRVMESIGSRTAVMTPANVDLKLITAPSTDAFERAVSARDRAIAKALLVPNLLGLSDQGSVGSYSQSRTQQETFFLIMNALAESIADTLNEQLFRELARWNFGLHDPPVFAFDPLSQQQKRDQAQAWHDAVRGGTVRHNAEDEVRIRELLEFPSRAGTA